MKNYTEQNTSGEYYIRFPETWYIIETCHKCLFSSRGEVDHDVSPVPTEELHICVLNPIIRFRWFRARAHFFEEGDFVPGRTFSGDFVPGRTFSASFKHIK